MDGPVWLQLDAISRLRVFNSRAFLGSGTVRDLKWQKMTNGNLSLKTKILPHFHDKDQIITACDHANSGFAADLCKVQTFFALEFMNEYFVSPPDVSYLEDGSQDLNAICNPRVGTGGNNKGKYIRCCNGAEYPDKKVVATLGSKGCN